MNKKLLGLMLVLSLGASGVLVACGGNGGTDAGGGSDTPMVMTDTPGVDAPGADVPGSDTPGGACMGSDGMPCLGVRGGTPDFSCTPTQSSGPDRMVNFRLEKRGLGASPFAGPFEVWTNNTIGGTCAAPNCQMFTAGADGMVAGTIPGNWYAYRVPRNAAAMTFDTVGFNREPAAAGGMDTITAIDATIFSTAIGLVRMGLTRDVNDGIITGDVGDCMGRGLSGTTVRLFNSSGMELMQGTMPTDMGIAYRAGGALPNPMLTTSDDSGGYAAANVPLPTDGLVNVVAYGTMMSGGAREVIGCEVVFVGAGVVTILAVGPSRTDYPAGSFCDTMTGT